MGKTNRKTLKKGIVGIEAAIVMIAFVIVAAALAFVVLNMGFFTTQQSRQVMQRGLGESSSALMVDGTVVATVDKDAAKIDYIYVPIKLSTGQYVVDLTPGKSIVGYWSPQRGISIANTYLMAVLTPVDTPQTLAEITNIAVNLGEKQTMIINKSEANSFGINSLSGSPILENNTKKLELYSVSISAPVIKGDKGQVIRYYVCQVVMKVNNTEKEPWFVILNETTYNLITSHRTFSGTNQSNSASVEVDRCKVAYIINIGLPDDVDSDGLTFKEFFAKFAGGRVVTVMAWITKVNDDIVLDPGEKVLMLTYYAEPNARPQSYDTIKLEVRVPIGAPLTIERNVPPSLTQGVVDLG